MGYFLLLPSFGLKLSQQQPLQLLFGLLIDPEGGSIFCQTTWYHIQEGCIIICTHL
jgi:hypothetical protein